MCSSTEENEEVMKRMAITEVVRQLEPENLDLRLLIRHPPGPLSFLTGTVARSQFL